MTVQQITEKLQKKAIVEGERLQFATIVKAKITEINLDGPLKNLISIKWYTFFHYIHYLINKNNRDLCDDVKFIFCSSWF